MVEPQHKRVKRPGRRGNEEVWPELPVVELHILHRHLSSKCLCQQQLQSILDSLNQCNAHFRSPRQIALSIDGSLLYASLLNLFFEVALKQRNRGVVCSRISEAVLAGADNEGDIINILFNFLGHSNKYISYSGMKALVSLLLLLQGPVSEVVLQQLVTIMCHSNNWLQVGHAAEAIKRIIEWKDNDEHPLDAESSGLPPECRSITLSPTDVFGSNEVKYIATKTLDCYWLVLVARSKKFFEIYNTENEHVIVSFLSLWTALISVKNNLNFEDTKEFYSGVETLIKQLLTHNTPLVVWEKILDLYNEVLCYGSTLALQEVLADEPCNLAHTLIRAVNTKHLFEFVPCGQSAEEPHQTHTDDTFTNTTNTSFLSSNTNTSFPFSGNAHHLSHSSNSNVHLSNSNPTHSTSTNNDIFLSSLADSNVRSPILPHHKYSSQSLNTSNSESLSAQTSVLSSTQPANNTSVLSSTQPANNTSVLSSTQPANNTFSVPGTSNNYPNILNVGISRPTDVLSNTPFNSNVLADLLAQSNNETDDSDDEEGCWSLLESRLIDGANIVSVNNISKFSLCNNSKATSRPSCSSESADSGVASSSMNYKSSSSSSSNPLSPPMKRWAELNNSLNESRKLSDHSCSDEVMSPLTPPYKPSDAFLIPQCNSKYDSVQTCVTNVSQRSCGTARICVVGNSNDVNYLGHSPSAMVVESTRTEISNEDECSSHRNSDAIVSSANLEKSIDGLQILQNCYGEDEESNCSDSDMEHKQSNNDTSKRLLLSVNDVQNNQMNTSTVPITSSSRSKTNLLRTSSLSLLYGNNESVLENGNNPDINDRKVNIGVDYATIIVPNKSHQPKNVPNVPLIFDGRETVGKVSGNCNNVNNFGSCSGDTDTSSVHSENKNSVHLFSSPQKMECSPSLDNKSHEISMNKFGHGGQPSDNNIGSSERLLNNYCDEEHLPEDVFYSSEAVNKASQLRANGDNCDQQLFHLSESEGIGTKRHTQGEGNTGEGPPYTTEDERRDQLFAAGDEALEEGESPHTESHLTRVLVRKVVLLVLKAIAVTVKEARGDASSSSSESSSPRSGTEEMDMQIIGRSLKEVLRAVDVFVKHREPYHPQCSMAEWLVKLFSAQDDWMVEAMVCGLDIHTGLCHSVRGISSHVESILCPHTTFFHFLDAVRYDASVLLDLLVSNETCFLLYLLRYLKIARRSWSTSLSSETRVAVSVMVQLRASITRLVDGNLFPYNISPILRLLDQCHALYASA